MRPRLLVASLALATVLGCAGFRAKTIARVADEQIGAPFHHAWRTDGELHVILAGTGSPLPSSARAGTSTAVLAGGHFLLFDVGRGSFAKLGLWRLPRGEVDGVFLTHFHSDHIAELGEVGMQSWALGRSEPLPVYGPPGVTEVVAGFEQAYALDAGYRAAHHGEGFMKLEDRPLVAREVDLPAAGESAVVFEDGELVVRAFCVDHDPVKPAFGYRVDYRGRSVVISGDTAKSATLEAQAGGADVLIHEALAEHMIGAARDAAARAGDARLERIFTDILRYHSTPRDAAEIAQAAEVGLLVLSHLIPPPDSPILRRWFLDGAEDVYGGEIVLGQDGLHLRLPPAGEAITREQLK